MNIIGIAIQEYRNLEGEIFSLSSKYSLVNDLEFVKVPYSQPYGEIEGMVGIFGKSAVGKTNILSAILNCLDVPEQNEATLFVEDKGTIYQIGPTQEHVLFNGKPIESIDDPKELSKIRKKLMVYIPSLGIKPSFNKKYKDEEVRRYAIIHGYGIDDFHKKSSSQIHMSLLKKTVFDSLVDSGGTVLIDDIDLGMHPKQQINVIKELNDLIKETKDKFGINNEINLILTTNSPLVLRDFVHKDLRKITRNDVGDYPITIPTEKTWGGNIYNMVFGIMEAKSGEGLHRDFISKIVDLIKKDPKSPQTAKDFKVFDSRIADDLLQIGIKNLYDSERKEKKRLP